ncbi:MAG: ribosomal protein S18-alanine N-acetyltransferase [Oscillospiraceae bacterium]|nr:ribosomal protein S18-alanine N-acetyltransferase [Oscillospiraceae bacterium]
MSDTEKTNEQSGVGGNYRIVPLSYSHVEAVAAIERECFSSPWSERSVAEEVENSAACFVVCEAEGKETGTVAGYAGMQFAGGFSMICNVAVTKKYRRQGIARALMEALICKCKELYIEELSLEVRISNTEAIALYEALGFKSIGIRPNFYSSPREDANIMSLYFTGDKQ